MFYQCLPILDGLVTTGVVAADVAVIVYLKKKHSV
jgi:hypothetical protein